MSLDKGFVPGSSSCRTRYPYTHTLGDLNGRHFLSHTNTQVLREFYFWFKFPSWLAQSLLLKVTSHDGESEPASSLVSLHRRELILLARRLTLVTIFNLIYFLSPNIVTLWASFNIWILRGHNSIQSRSKDAKHKLMEAYPLSFSHHLLSPSIHLLSVKPFQLHRLGKTLNAQEVIFKVTENKSEWIQNISFPRRLLLESPYSGMSPVQWSLSAIRYINDDLQFKSQHWQVRTWGSSQTLSPTVFTATLQGHALPHFSITELPNCRSLGPCWEKSAL